MASTPRIYLSWLSLQSDGASAPLPPRVPLPFAPPPSVPLCLPLRCAVEEEGGLGLPSPPRVPPGPPPPSPSVRPPCTLCWVPLPLPTSPLLPPPAEVLASAAEIEGGLLCPPRQSACELLPSVWTHADGSIESFIRAPPYYTSVAARLVSATACIASIALWSRVRRARRGAANDRRWSAPRLDSLLPLLVVFGWLLPSACCVNYGTEGWTRSEAGPELPASLNWTVTIVAAPIAAVAAAMCNVGSARGNQAYADALRSLGVAASGLGAAADAAISTLDGAATAELHGTPSPLPPEQPGTHEAAASPLPPALQDMPTREAAVSAPPPTEGPSPDWSADGLPSVEAAHSGCLLYTSDAADE